MKPLLACLLASCMTGGMAQSWCAPGARWYHNDFESVMWGDDAYVETHFTGDTIIAGSVCERFEHTFRVYYDLSQTVHTQGPFEFYTTTSNDMVHLYQNEQFDTLFNFAAFPGERWSVPDGGGIPEMWVTVLDTGHSVIDEITLRYQVVNVVMDEDVILVENDTIYERIGPTYMYLYLPVTAGIIIDGGYFGLRCYEDDEMTYTRVSGRCDIGLDADEHPASNSTTIGPNPASDHVNVFGATTLTTAVLTDLTGRTVRSWPIVPEGNALNISGIAPGRYVLRLGGTGIAYPLMIAP